MAITCCVYKCSNDSNNVDKTRSFHRFPKSDKSPELHRQWLCNIQRADFVPTKYTYVCSDHFLPDDFELSNRLKLELMPNVKSKPCLKATAVPTVNLTGPSTRIELPKEIQDNVASGSERKRRKTVGCENVAFVKKSRAVGRPRKGRIGDGNALQSNDLIANDSVLSSLSSEIEIQCELGKEMFRNAMKADTSVVKEEPV